MTPPSVKLPLSFDSTGLKRDAARISEPEWTPHFNSAIYEGDWSGVALRSVGGRTDKLYPDPTATVFADTEMLGRCPYVQEVLAAFRCPLTSVRILRLRAGAKIGEHRDYNLAYEDGEVRVHIPMQTAPEVAFFLDGRQVFMEEGEAWYLNLNLPHRVHNASSIDRLHLVVDCVVNDWLAGLFQAAESQPGCRSGLMSTHVPRQNMPRQDVLYSDLERFRELVLSDPALQERLREPEDADRFVALVLQLSRERGFDFTVDDVNAAMQAGRRVWIEL